MLVYSRLSSMTLAVVVVIAGCTSASITRIISRIGSLATSSVVTTLLIIIIAAVVDVGSVVVVVSSVILPITVAIVAVNVPTIVCILVTTTGHRPSAYRTAGSPH